MKLDPEFVLETIDDLLAGEIGKGFLLPDGKPIGVMDMKNYNRYFLNPGGDSYMVTYYLQQVVRFRSK